MQCCVGEKSKSKAHHVQIDIEKDKYKLPIVSIDSTYMHINDEDNESGNPILVVEDRSAPGTGMTLAHVRRDKCTSKCNTDTRERCKLKLGQRRLIFESEVELALISLNDTVKPRETMGRYHVPKDKSYTTHDRFKGRKVARAISECGEWASTQNKHAKMTREGRSGMGRNIC